VTIALPITKGLAQWTCRASRVRRFFDTFRYPILPYLHELVTRPTVSRVLTIIELICPNGRNLLCVELYVISEYRPYRASEYSVNLEVMQTQHSGAESRCRLLFEIFPICTRSRCFRNCRRRDCSSLLSSGLWCECSLSVGIRLVILAAVMGVEHLNYACHP